MNRINELAELPDFFPYHGASPKAISEAEAALQTSFADDYSEYLAAFGLVSANSHELTGICPFPRLNVVDVTIAEREFDNSADVSWYVIERLGIDDVVAWQSPEGDIYLTAEGVAPRKVATSLFDYLSN